jgi:tetratricopeptide (TPR) repeat protein
MMEIDPMSAEAHVWHGLATLLLPNGTWDAVDSLTRAVELNEASVWAKVAKGLALIVDVRALGAQLEFEDALRLTPGFVPAILGYASAFNAQGRYEDALPLVNRVLDIEPENAIALTMRGDCHMALLNFRDAAADFDAAIRVVGQDSSLAWRALAARVQQSKMGQRPPEEATTRAQPKSDDPTSPPEGNLPVVDWLQKLVWPRANPPGPRDGKSRLRSPRMSAPGLWLGR